MMTILFLSQTFAVLPNSRLNTPIVPGPQTSWVISTSALTQMLSPACTRALPAARAKIFSVNVIIEAFSLTDAARGRNCLGYHRRAAHLVVTLEPALPG